jgi:hypothetical protein
MTNEMKQFLTELAELLEKHDFEIEAGDYCLIVTEHKRNVGDSDYEWERIVLETSILTKKDILKELLK